MANMAPTILSIPTTPLHSSSSSPSLSDLPIQTTSQPNTLAEHQHLGMTIPNLLPFKIDYSGPAKISTYFLIRPFPAPSSSSDPTPPTPSNDVEAPPPSRLLSSFRGRQLVGQPTSFPKGYAGVVLDIPAPPSSSSSTHNSTIDSLNKQPDTLQGSFDEEAEEHQLSRGNTLRPRTRQQPARYGSAGPQAAAPLAGALKGAAAAKASKAGVKRKARKFKLDSDSEEGEEEEMYQPKEEEVVEQEQPGDVVKEEQVQEKEKVEEETSTSMMEGVEEEAAGLPTPLPSTTTSSTNPTVTSFALPSALLFSSSSTAVLPPSSPHSPPPQIISHSPSPQQQQQQPPPTSPSSQSHPHASSVPPRTISVKSTFSSLMLWSPDDPVDEGRDEYCRAMGKGGWIELAGVLAESESEGEGEA